MTGTRQLTKGLGLIERTPPEQIVADLEDEVPGLLAHVPAARRQAAIELFHWAYGAAGGVVFALAPAAIRRRTWSGPAYGLLVWAGFAAVIAPALKLPMGGHEGRERLVLLADHLLYGAIVGGRFAPPAE